MLLSHPARLFPVESHVHLLEHGSGPRRGAYPSTIVIVLRTGSLDRVPQLALRLFAPQGSGLSEPVTDWMSKAGWPRSDGPRRGDVSASRLPPRIRASSRLIGAF